VSLICFSESEPHVFSSLAKTHKVVKLKRRPQWWPNAFVGNVNWRKTLKHMHYLLAIIESSSFVCSLVASLVGSHHWRRRFYLITYCSSAWCCKAVRSSCFSFRLHLSWSWKWLQISPGFLAMKTCHPIVLRLPHKTTSDSYQTGWNVTKCCACHAKWHDNLLGHLRKREVLQLPLDTARPQENERLETRHVGASKRAFRARLPPILTLCSFKIDVFLRVILRYWKFATAKSMFRARFPSIFIPCRHLT